MKGVIVVAAFLLFPLITFAQWNDCTHGKIDESCSYPGECGSYTDSNADKICDHSQRKPVIKKKVVKNMEEESEALVVGAAVESVVSEEIKNGAVTGQVDTSLGDMESVIEGEITNDQMRDGDIGAAVEKKNKPRYPLLQITIVTTILYLLTYFLAKRKVIKMIMHKKIWNILLTISFLAMAALSVVLIIQINSGRMFLPNFDALYWHVITGIVMMVITIFHMGWHWRYYKNLFKK